MMLLTAEIKEKLKKAPLGRYSETSPDQVPILVKFFDPTGSWTWYATEGEEQEDGDWLFFGLVRGHETELGYFTLNELLHAKDGIRGLRGLPIERDRHFGKHTLAEAWEKRI